MQEETPSCKPQGYSPVVSLPTRDGAPNTDEAKLLGTKEQITVELAKVEERIRNEVGNEGSGSGAGGG